MSDQPGEDAKAGARLEEASAEPLNAKLTEAEIKRENEEEKLWFAAVTALKQYEETKKTPPRAGVEAIWRAIAHGGLLSGEDTAKWAKFVAEDVVKNVIDETKEPHRRPNRAAAALKIVGHAENNIEELEELRNILWAFTELKIGLSDPRTPLELKQKIKDVLSSDRPPPTQFAKELVARGFFKGISLKKAAKRTERLLERLDEERKFRR